MWHLHVSLSLCVSSSFFSLRLCADLQTLNAMSKTIEVYRNQPQFGDEKALLKAQKEVEDCEKKRERLAVCVCFPLQTVPAVVVVLVVVAMLGSLTLKLHLSGTHTHIHHLSLSFHVSQSHVVCF